MLINMYSLTLEPANPPNAGGFQQLHVKLEGIPRGIIEVALFSFISVFIFAVYLLHPCTTFMVQYVIRSYKFCVFVLIDIKQELYSTLSEVNTLFDLTNSVICFMCY